MATATAPADGANTEGSQEQTEQLDLPGNVVSYFWSLLNRALTLMHPTGSR